LKEKLKQDIAMTFMNKRSLFLSTFACVLLAGACSREDLPPDEYTFSTEDPIPMDVSIQQNDSYKTREFVLDDGKLRQTFGATPLQDLMFYAVDSNGLKHVGADDYTSEFGFYFTRSGNVCMPSAPRCAYFVDYYGFKDGKSKLVIAIGQNPGSCVAGDTATLQIGLADSLTGQPFLLKISIRPASPWAIFFENRDGMTYTVYETINADYKPLEVFVNETVLAAALGVTSPDKIVSGISNKTISFSGVNADGTLYANGYTANNYGHWFDRDGNVCFWKGDNCSIYSEWYGASPISFNIGQFPASTEVGDKFTVRQAFINGTHQATLTFKIRIVDEVTDDLGPDDTGL
jgi:hypothetical protein